MDADKCLQDLPTGCEREYLSGIWYYSTIAPFKEVFLKSVLAKFAPLKSAPVKQTLLKSA
jgi:hypothetical protein